MYSHIKN